MPFPVSLVARRRSITVALGFASLSALSFATAPKAAQAQYLINPAGGTALFSGNQVNAYNGASFFNDVDDGHLDRTLGFNFSYFGGAATNTISVSTNGNLNFNGNTSFNNVAFPTTTARIAVLWDDLVIKGSTDANISEISNANYYAVTWNVNETIQSSSNSNRQQFQIALFGANTTIGNRTFNVGDIAFSYNTLVVPFVGNDATIGLNKGDSATAVLAPNAPAGGFYTTAQATTGPTAVPFFPTTNNILLFSRSGSTYTSSIVNVTAAAGPEPGSLALLGMGLVPLAGLVARRRRAADAPPKQRPNPQRHRPPQTPSQKAQAFVFLR